MTTTLISWQRWCFARIFCWRVTLSPFSISKHFVGRCFETIKSPISHQSLHIFICIHMGHGFLLYPASYILLQSFILLHKLSQIRLEVLLQADSFRLQEPIFFFFFFLSTSLLSGTVGYFRLILYFSYCSPDFCLFSKESWFFLVENGI